MFSLPTVAMKAGQEKSDFLTFFICVTKRYGKEDLSGCIHP